ncbi:peptide deformylase [Rhodobacter sp. Har01]|uniref:peptide deformylase n=1 Tax=Rhodobacter sp. Har01 TaxID=2883999 RepID=UPI001D087718|nr:peptide deformylase [Rhodobacter sp. Har01]MCB6177681.1 peptide deformylase [Rhodobacter sp. Har01]
MILPILRWPDPLLSQPCAPAVLSDDLRALAADMLETMYAACGRGLAAPQVGRLLRLFVMDTTWKEGTRAPRVLVNPEMVEVLGPRVVGPEGCLSIPGATALVERAQAVRLRWTDLSGDRQEEVLTGFAAICVQHEHDHLDGILTLDRLAPEARARAEAEVLA